jgi:hypothetical protein
MEEILEAYMLIERGMARRIIIAEIVKWALAKKVLLSELAN